MAGNGVNYSELLRYRQGLAQMIEDWPEIMANLTLQEGLVAVRHAREIATGDGVVNTGAYRQAFHAGNREVGQSGDKMHDGSDPARRGDSYSVDVYNNLEYALYLEKGYRKHFVPGHWEGEIFVYNPGDPEGGMMVGPHRGHWTLRRAMKRAEKTQGPRLQRKVAKIMRGYLHVATEDEVTE